MSRRSRNEGALCDKSGKWNAARSAGEYDLVGSVASMLANQLEGANHRWSRKSRADKLGDFFSGVERVQCVGGDHDVTASQ